MESCIYRTFTRIDQISSVVFSILAQHSRIKCFDKLQRTLFIVEALQTNEAIDGKCAHLLVSLRNLEMMGESYAKKLVFI